MNKLILLFLILFIHNFGFSQNKFKYSIDIAPIYSYRNYSLNKCYPHPSFSKDTFFKNYNKLYDSVEYPRTTMGFSLGIAYEFHNKYQIQSGISYKTIGEKTFVFLPTGYMIIDGEKIPIEYKYSNNLPYVINNSYSYISVPANFQHSIYQYKKLSCGYIIGANVDVLIQSFIRDHSDYPYLFDTKHEYGKVSRITGNLHTAIHLDYKINEKFSLYMQPDFATYIFPNVQVKLQVNDALYYYKLSQYNYYFQVRFRNFYKLEIIKKNHSIKKAALNSTAFYKFI